MPDQITETTNTMVGRTLSEVDNRLEQLSRDTDYEAFSRHPGVIVLSVVISAMIMTCIYFMSRNYETAEREALAEAERNRIAEEEAEIAKMETFRSKISKIIDGYTIHLKMITSDKSNNKSHDDDDVPVETVTIISNSSKDDPEDIEQMAEDIDDEDDLTSGHACWSPNDTLKSTLTIDETEKNAQTLKSIPSSLSISSTLDRAHLREAVRGNPCAICLEPFKAGDDIVYCCNRSLQRPHIFHQNCSLDYVVHHPQGVKAPCPCCREVLLPNKEQQQKWGAIRCSHGSALTLPDLDEPIEEL